MKPLCKASLLSLVSSSAITSLLSVRAVAQEAAVTPGAPATATTAAASEQSAAPVPVPPAPDASAQKNPPTDRPATPDVQAPAPMAASATLPATRDTTVTPLAPIEQDSLKKKNKKKRKRGKAQAIERRFGGNASEADADEWGDPWGNSQDELRAAGLSFRFLVQTHYQFTHVSKSQNSDESYRAPEELLAHRNDGWDVNRLFFRIMAEPSRYLSLKMITDFAEFQHGNASTAVKQAYVDIKPLPKHIHVLAGILKLPYSITELDPIAKYEFTSLGQANDLMKKLDFGGRDTGLELEVTPLSKPRYLRAVVGAFQGQSKDEHASLVGSIGARVESRPVKELRVGADWVEQPRSVTYLEYFDTSDKDLMVNPDNVNAPIAKRFVKGQAYSGDITFESLGLSLRTEAMYGTRIDYYTRYGAQNFAAIWGVTAYKFPVGSLKFQPALRVEWLDTDTQHSSGERLQLTAAFGTYFTPAIRALIDVTRTDVQDNTPVVDQPSPLPQVPYNALSSTRVTAQLQVVL